MKQATDLPTNAPRSANPIEDVRGLIWRDRLLLALPVVLYLLARLPALWSLPLFNDEAVYLLRAQRFPNLIGGTIGDGKLLQELVLAALVQLPGDPLLWSRLFSVVCGLGTLIALLLFGRAIGKPSAGIVAGVLYASAPVAVLHDRLGLPDSMLTCAMAYLLLASIVFARTPSPTRSQALVIGGLIGMAMLVKLPGLFFVYVPILAVLALADSWADARRRLVLLRVAAIVVLACLAVLLLAQYGSNERHKAELGSFDERLALMGHYFWTIGGWLLTYLPAPLLIVPLLALAFGRRLRASSWRMVALLLVWGMVHYAIFLLLGNTLYSRYLMPAWPALLLACGVGAVEVWRASGNLRQPARALCVVAIGMALAWDGFFAVQLLRNPVDAPMVTADRSQYLETWTAGYGISEIMETLRSIAAEQDGMILVNHYQPRLIHLAPQIYLRGDPRMTQHSLDLQLVDAPDQLRRLAVLQPVYVLLDEEEQQAFHFERRFPAARLLRTFENPLGTMHFYLYEQPRSLVSIFS